MKLGFLTGYSEDIVNFAGKGPFDCLEISGPPGEWIGDSDEACAAKEKAKSVLDANSVIVASFMMGWPSIQSTAEELKGQLEQLAQVMDVANFMGGAVLTGAGPMGFDPAKSLKENTAMFKAVYTPVAELAAEKGVKIGFENWPAGRPFGHNASLAATPESWELMFEAVDSEFIGLEFDPSHLMWQWVDPYEAVKKFVDKINMVHLKDTEIDKNRLSFVGTHGGGWWRYRLPGYGRFDWEKFFAILKESGYTGNCVIEHEDPVFSGERHREGLIVSGAYLRAIIGGN